MFKTAPAVFAVGDTYQIMVPVSAPSLMWVKVGNECFYDESNGIIRSLVEIHRMSVPRELLDEVKEYTVCERVIIDRKPYFPEIEEVVETKYNFYPVPDENAKAFHISDTHNRIETPIAAAKNFGDIDFLILNGDIPDHSGTPDNFINIYEIVAGITKGEKPTVFARGNHDLRGTYAEKFADFTPEQYGNTYYTFRLGSIWGLILDCGEDKDDSHAEYGGTVACHVFRKRQTKFICDIIKKAQNNEEYAAPGVKTRVVVCHNPFNYQLCPPFNIEDETYTEWIKLLESDIHPHAMICGHFHLTTVLHKGDASKKETYAKDGELENCLGEPCDVIIGSCPNGDGFTGAGIIFGENDISVEFISDNGDRYEKDIITKE